MSYSSMSARFVFLILAGALSITSATFSWATPSRYSYFTKRLAPNIYTGGKVTERQLQYLSQAGFKSILSTLYQEEELDSFNGVSGPFPSSNQEIEISSKLNMTALVIETTLTRESALKVSDAILALEKPIYIHCGVGYGASLFTQLHLFRVGVTPAEEIFPNSITLGWDFQADAGAVALVNEVARLSPPATVQDPILEITLTNGESSYKSYYWSHRVGNDTWYNSGQVLSTQVATIAAAGYKAVISFRSNGEATSRTNTDPSTGAVSNDEFSDANGNYNVTAEQVAFEAVGVQFFNLPVSGAEAWTSAQLSKYSTAMRTAASLGPVLAHCTSGYRSSGYVTAFLAKETYQCTAWALQQARRIGYSFDVKESDAGVVKFYEDSLEC